MFQDSVSSISVSVSPYPQAERSILSTDQSVELDDDVQSFLTDWSRQQDSTVAEHSLDPTGTTSHRSFDLVERERWESGQEMASKLASVGLDEVAGKLRHCHSFWSVRRCCGCNEAVRFWNRCDLFWCPQCSPRLASKRLTGLVWYVEKMKQPKHVVLTFRNVAVLTKSYLKSCLKAFQKLRRRKVWKPVRSGLWCMEITNEGNGWHVHYHLVIDSPWLAQSELSEAWKSCTEDGSFIVWVNSASHGSVRKNLPKYVTKYAGKGFRPHSWSAENLAEFVTAIDGVRTFGVFGDLVGQRKAHREFLNEVRTAKQVCSCGCRDFRYFSEMEWLIETELSLPPPVKKLPPFSKSAIELPLNFLNRPFGAWAN